MILFYELSGCAVVFLSTYLFFRFFGPRNNSLLYTRAQKTNWDQNLSSTLGTWLVVTSIFGTLTSFATYNFFTGSVKLFGWFALATCFTIMLSPIVTNRLTKPVKNAPRVKQLLEDNDQITGVVASLFWGESRDQKALSAILKWGSIASILSIVWLEFTAFVDVTSNVNGLSLSNPHDLLSRGALMFMLVFLVLFFVFRYGIRGFVFADLLHTPVIGAAVIVVLVVLLSTNWSVITSVPILSLTTPLLTTSFNIGHFRIPYIAGVVFTIHVLFLNTLQIVCSEPHWFRVWLLKEKEDTGQALGAVLTGLGWLILVPIGFIAYLLAQRVGDPAVGKLLASLGSASPAWITVFWIGALAALFSTTDMQAYSALLVSRFNLETGKIDDLAMDPNRSFWVAIFVSLGFTAAYLLVRLANLPFDKLLVDVVPSVLVLSPAFIHYWLGREPRAWVIVLSGVGYLGVAAVGFVLPSTNLFMSLAAAYVPVCVAFLTFSFMEEVPLNLDQDTGGKGSGSAI